MKILFASTHCLLDATSGAAISMRILLSNLAAMGHDVSSCTATVFDSENGAKSAAALFQQQEKPQQLLVHNGGVRHFLAPTSHWARGNIHAGDMERLDNQYQAMLESNRPDLVITYGGMVSERFILSEARDLGIKTAFMLVNPSYQHQNYFKHVDYIFTDTPTTAARYKAQLGINVTPIGKLLEPEAVVCRQWQPEYVTFINPSFNKGVNLVARLALMCRDRAPNIKFLVVESRGSWAQSLATLGLDAAQLSNVTVLPTQFDMRSVYARTKVLLIPSMWYESGARVGMEALANGIPVIVESAGGTKDLLGDAAIILDIPEHAREKRNLLMSEEDVTPWFDAVTRLLADEEYYKGAHMRAKRQADAFDRRASAEAFLEMLKT